MNPIGWTVEDVKNNPMQAILEHTYGNCSCTTGEQCLCAIAAIGEYAIKQKEQLTGE